MTDFILNLIQGWGYAGIFILMFLENVFPPIPSEVIMGLGGIAVAKGHFDFWTLVAVAVAGTTAGNWVWYGIGRWIGYERLKPFIDRHGRWLTLDWGRGRALARLLPEIWPRDRRSSRASCPSPGRWCRCPRAW